MTPTGFLWRRNGGGKPIEIKQQGEEQVVVDGVAAQASSQWQAATPSALLGPPARPVPERRHPQPPLDQGAERLPAGRARQGRRHHQLHRLPREGAWALCTRPPPPPPLPHGHSTTAPGAPLPRACRTWRRSRRTASSSTARRSRCVADLCLHRRPPRHRAVRRPQRRAQACVAWCALWRLGAAGAGAGDVGAQLGQRGAQRAQPGVPGGRQAGL